jgi:transposase
MARPSKLTDALVQNICDVVAAGNYIETAAAYAGIGKTTLYEWLKRGRGDLMEQRDTEHSRFVERVELALAEGEVRDLATIEKAAETVWQAAAWRLERRMPEKFGRRSRIDHATPDGKPFSVNHSFDPTKLSNDELDALEALLEKAAPSKRPHS